MESARIEGLGHRQWKCHAPRAIFLLVHGLGAHAGRWEALADFFLQREISSYAVELADLDRPDTSAYRSSHFRSYYSEILSLYEIAARENPAKPIFLVGESLGALISFLLCADRPGLFRGLICISPAFANRYKLTPLECVRVFAPLFYNPKKHFPLPFGSYMCTRDRYYQDKMDQDPREHRSASSKLILEMLVAEARAKAVKGRMATPALFLIAGEDRIVDPDAAKAVFRTLAVKDKALVEFPGMYHSLSIELGKESVFEEMLRWVEGRL